MLSRVGKVRNDPVHRTIISKVSQPRRVPRVGVSVLIGEHCGSSLSSLKVPPSIQVSRIGTPSTAKSPDRQTRCLVGAALDYPVAGAGRQTEVCHDLHHAAQQDRRVVCLGGHGRTFIRARSQTSSAASSRYFRRLITIGGGKPSVGSSSQRSSVFAQTSYRRQTCLVGKSRRAGAGAERTRASDISNPHVADGHEGNLVESA